MRILFLIVLLCSSCFATAQRTVDDLLQQYNTHSVPYISVEELRMQQVNGSIIILDAREPEEFEVSHLPSAQHIGSIHFSSEEVSNKISDKDTPIVVYCSLGIRSEAISEKLKKAGFTNVKNLYGGLFEWKNKGYPIVNSQRIETDKVHVYSRAWEKWLLQGEKVYK